MKNGWHEGTIGIPAGDKTYIAHYWVKQYSRPSKEYGINGGKISKLLIEINGKARVSYDRAWDIKPADDDQVANIALCILLNDYN